MLYIPVLPKQSIFPVGARVSSKTHKAYTIICNLVYVCLLVLSKSINLEDDKTVVSMCSYDEI